MAIVKSFEYFVKVKSNIVVLECWDQNLAFCVRHVLVYESRCFRNVVSQNIVQLHNIWPAKQSLQDFDLSVNLLNLDWLQDLQNAFLIVNHIASLVHFRILSTTQFVVALVRIHIAPRNIQLPVKTVVRRSSQANCAVISRPFGILLKSSHPSREFVVFSLRGLIFHFCTIHDFC